MFDLYITEMKLRSDERLREAEHSRLVSQFSAAEPYSGRTDRALAALGRTLSRWGRQLEENHSATEMPAMGRPVSDYLKLVTEPSPSQASIRMVALDQCGAAHKHMDVYSHSHRG